MLIVRKIVLLILGAAVQMSDGGLTSVRGAILMTPRDTGSTQAGWTVSRGTLPAVTKGGGRGSAITPAAIAAKLKGQKPFEITFVALPRAQGSSLEFGLYPNPVKKGSWDKKKKEFVIKSEGGFSKQAKKGGMLGVTITQVVAVLP